jgi:hypothetical protein
MTSDSKIRPWTETKKMAEIETETEIKIRTKVDGRLLW